MYGAEMYSGSREVLLRAHARVAFVLGRDDIIDSIQVPSTGISGVQPR